jgi:hypothetical protein
MKHGVAMGARTAFRDTAEHAAAIVSIFDSNAFNVRPFPPSHISDWYRSSSRILLAVVKEFESVTRRCHPLPSSSLWFRSALVHSLTHSVDMTLMRHNVNEGAKNTMCLLWFVRDGSVVLYGATRIAKSKLSPFEKLLTEVGPDSLEAFRLASENSIGSRFDICAGAL